MNEIDLALKHHREMNAIDARLHARLEMIQLEHERIIRLDYGPKDQQFTTTRRYYMNGNRPIFIEHSHS